MKVLVTGGAGFIGSHLCRALLSFLGEEVICLDNLSTGRLENIEDLIENPNFTFVNHDITKPLNVEVPIDAVMHLASPASPADFEKLSLEILDVGSVGTKNALEIARKFNAKFLLASTSEVYGDPTEHPQSESYLGNVNPLSIRGAYDESKRFAESLTMAYHRKYGLDTKIARIFNTFGPNMRLDDGRAIPNFFTQALRNETVTIYGDGQQTRSLCYVYDLVEGLVELLDSDYNSPVNLGNPEEMSIIQIAELITDLCGSKSTIMTTQQLPENDPQVRCPDITLALELLDWEPIFTVERGLSITKDYFEKELMLAARLGAD